MSHRVARFRDIIENWTALLKYLHLCELLPVFDDLVNIDAAGSCINLLNASLTRYLA